MCPHPRRTNGKRVEAPIDGAANARGRAFHVWYVDRWRCSEAYRSMNATEQGVYRNLLDEAVLCGGPIPNDDAVLERASGDRRAWPKVRAVVLAWFTLGPEGWRNRTVDRFLRQSTLHAERQRRYRERH